MPEPVNGRCRRHRVLEARLEPDVQAGCLAEESGFFADIERSMALAAGSEMIHDLPLEVAP
ncbi:MAG: hypothetical protein QM820_11905 [Minicystis sp.]